MTLGVDKLKHFAVGFLIALIGAYLVVPCLGLAAAFLAGVAKETWDACHPPDTFDVWDLLATAIGGFAGSALIWSALGMPPC